MRDEEDIEYWCAFEADFDDNTIDFDNDLELLSLDSEPLPFVPVVQTHAALNASSSFYEGYTARLRRVVAVLESIRHQGLNLELFFDALFWGDNECTTDTTIQYERKVFMRSPTLLRVLSHWWDPPTSKSAGGGEAMDKFVLACAGKLLENEMEDIALQFCPPPDILSKEKLTGVNFREVGCALQSTGAPRLWSILQRLAWSPRQQKENTVKNPFHVILTIILMLSYTRSHQSCILTIVWSIYLKACGLSARSFDALHALGFTMSQKWSYNAYTTISKTDNLSMFINASAATIYILPKEAFLPPDISEKVKAQRREAALNPLSLEDVYTRTDTFSRVDAQACHRILRFLLDSPAFKDYPHHNSALFDPPPPVDLLPCGPEHITEQRILATVEVDESSYDGTDQLCNNIWLEQMGLGSDDLLVWVGDQLTVDWIRGLTRYRHDDANSFERMEWLEPVFGWFHALMAYANSLHNQYLGTSAGIGLRKAFEKLGRKGLMKTETKGIFWHNLDKALWHVGEANFLALWMTVSGVDNLEDLTARSPEELMDLLERIFSQHVSRAAQAEMENAPSGQRNEVRRQMAMFSADLLGYFDLREAMQVGDVGRMEDLLPTMLFRFAGGGSFKYATEVLELLHKLQSEWPPELRVYIRRYCWLVNFTGTRAGFLAVDMAQEHNIKDIKVTWRSFGPGATFSYIQKVSPAIPVLRAVKANIASQFPSVQARGTHHGTPSKDDDVAQIAAMYRAANVHGTEPGQGPLSALADRAEGVITMGAIKLASDGVYDRWWNDQSFSRTTTEIHAVPNVQT
ncbi:hypothetical protein C8Q73DRAFT_741902 [Cubamyces lactineus]|nr:hypothetical protein C8Q73DRAFT_741902 [Cubamyces lactineus]